MKSCPFARSCAAHAAATLALSLSAFLASPASEPLSIGDSFAVPADETSEPSTLS